MSHARRIFAVGVLVALAWAVAPVAQAQPPIRIGASLPQTGLSAALGQDQLRGYQLCVKHLNDKGGVLGRKATGYRELPIRPPGPPPQTLRRRGVKLGSRTSET